MILQIEPRGPRAQGLTRQSVSVVSSTPAMWNEHGRWLANLTKCAEVLRSHLDLPSEDLREFCFAWLRFASGNRSVQTAAFPR